MLVEDNKILNNVKQMKPALKNKIFFLKFKVSDH